MRACLWGLLAWIALWLGGCDNSPHEDGAAASNTLYTAFSERSPRHLDPTASYYNNETPFTYSIYEPLYGYHYLKRPYELVPKAAEAVVAPRYLGAKGEVLPEDAPGEQVVESVYDIRIRPGVRYQPHPAFVPRYQHLDAQSLGERRSPWDFEEQGSRELVAEDFVYALKRHATTRITAPVFGVFSEYVIGLKAYGELIRQQDKVLRAGLDPASPDKPFLDFRRWPLEGVSAPEKYLLRIRLHGKYPQWKYWMAMTFLAPVPWEADAFYNQPGMAARGLSLDRWPVGTGPYMMAESVQDRRHVLKRNPNYHPDTYPCEGTPEDRTSGMLDDCGKSVPFIDSVVFKIEKEAVPLKAKFRQGYLDVPEVERPDYGVAFAVEKDDSPEVAREFEERGIRLPRFVDLSSHYLGFNMSDPVVGQGSTPAQQASNRALRQAIAIAIDWEEYLRIFPKAAGEPAMGPLPAGLFGSHHGTPEGLNPITHRLKNAPSHPNNPNDLIERRPIEDAQALMVQAGYPEGRDPHTGKPLVLNYDYSAQPSPERKAEFDWMIRQFAKLGIQLDIRATDNNQFQDKVRRGQHQIFVSGWLADYPDAENFLFLLYGPNGKTASDGENTANYANPAFDKLYQQLKLLDDGPAKQAVIDQMVALVREDAPWVWGTFPYASSAFHAWVKNGKPAIMIRDMLRYYRLDTVDRVTKQRAWNQPVLWPLLPLAACVAVLVGLGRRAWRQRERAVALRRGSAADRATDAMKEGA
ncbi:MAG: ABC transporter substrate-binding protein [Leptothrix ochracea]|uniref:ABC transporter substrate-binding protein n=2 Tax=Leptothrix ochracea TaxID=735331 RepID=UPI0034E19906